MLSTTFLFPAHASETKNNVTNASLNVDSDGADRINYSGKLRMLTQRVAASSCALSSDISPEENHDILEAATKEFDKIINGLRNGDEDLHILGPETSRTMLHDLDELEAEWALVHKAIDEILIDGHNIEAAHFIDDHNLKLLDLAIVLAADVNAKYADPFELSQADAMMIDIAGRQRMLTQKMAKDACEVWTGYHAQEAKDDLRKTTVIFENSMKALRYGMPEAGIQAAPTPQIEKDLDIILARWDEIRDDLYTLMEGGEIDDAAKVALLKNLNAELVEINHLVYDYRDYAERAH